MKTPFTSKSIPQPVRRRIDLAVAVAQERLLNTHVEHALDLIKLIGNRVPFDHALDIYHRLLRLTDDEARIITTRALATLGQTGGRDDRWHERMAEGDAAAEVGRRNRGLIGQLKERLRGRINDDLRRWIELEAARTEVAVLETHVGNALNFVDILEDEMPFTEAVELYLEALDVRESIGEVVYYVALTRLSDRILPKRSERGTRTLPGPIAAGTESQAVRALEAKGD